MADNLQGRDLHREFVGMLFALAIAQVAIQAAIVVNSGLEWTKCLASYTHLVFAATVIATSWVGWGWSKHSLSDIRNVFTIDFLELAVDLWLVAIYFFIVMSTELPTTNSANITTLTPSLAEESWWLMFVFATYFVWDLLTKTLETNEENRIKTFQNKKGEEKKCGWWKRDENNRYVIFQRGWASLICACLGFAAYYWLPISTHTLHRVILGDLSLLSLVFLFRAMKLKSLSEMDRWQHLWIAITAALFVVFLLSCKWF